MKLMFIAIGGAGGALLRYAVSGLTYKYLNGAFPWGTLVVNLIGCFAIGFLWQMFETFAVSQNVRSFAIAGVLGAFTTFSAFGIETFNLYRSDETGLAALNILASNILGIAFVFLGFTLCGYLIDLCRR